MCAICGSSPCMSGCPNEPEPAVFSTCAYCNEEIVDGENYVDFDGREYHEDCFTEAAEGILFEEYGAERCIAEVDSFVGIGF